MNQDAPAGICIAFPASPSAPFTDEEPTDMQRLIRWIGILACALWASTAGAQMLTDGGVDTGSISPAGNEDTYTFQGRTGDTVWLSMTDVNGSDPNLSGDVYPYLLLYGPNGGDPVARDWDRSAAVMAAELPLNGTYTVVARSYDGTGTGPYEIRLAKVPGAQEHGKLVNGGVATERLTLGDIDTYTFDAEAGDVAWLSMTDVNGGDPNSPGDVYPYLLLYGPDGGASIARDWDRSAAVLTTELPLSGTYTVVVLDYASTGTGPYELRLARVPGAQEHGGLPNGGMVAEQLTLGDIDTYTFHGESGDVAWLSMTDVNGGDPNRPGNVYPYLLLYGPDGGTSIARDWNRSAAAMSVQLPLDGTYTVVALDYANTGTGPYEVRLARVPGAREHGGLANGGTASERLTLGDIDTYTFYGRTGDRVSLSASDLEGSDPNLPGNVYPYLLLYGPNGGSSIARDWDRSVAAVSIELPLNGAYTVVVRDYAATGTGPYSLEFSSTARGTPSNVTPRPLGENGNARQPVLSWLPVGYATWYRVWVQDLSGAVLHQQWYPAARAGCPGGSGSCWIIPPVTIDAAVRWWVLPWNEQGGAGSWGAYDQFSTVAGAPRTATPLSPVSSTTSRTPEYRWERVGNASWYRVWVDDATGPRFRQWLTAGQADCAEVGQTCRFRFDSSVTGQTRWWVRTWNADGGGAWSSSLRFTPSE